MLIHGTADGDVHVQNSMLLIKSLIEYARIKNQHDMQYSSQLYPDDDHEYTNSKLHLHRTMSSYVKSCYDAVIKPIPGA